MGKTEEEQHQLHYFGFSIHQEVASGPFCLLVNSPWLLVFALLFFLYVLGLNLYCWKGIHFSWSLDFIFFCLFSGLIITLHFWFRDLLRELNKKYETLLMVLFLVFSNAAVSLGGAFISLEISSSFMIFFSLFSFILAWTFISLQIKEFRIMGLPINDSVYSCVFFFLTGLHFFHLVVGLFLLSLFFWGCSFPSHVYTFINLRISEVHLFYNLLNFYWHFLEILWLFIFLFLYSLSSHHPVPHEGIKL